MIYSLAFIFDRELNRVALIRKNRPEFLAGCWNGIGGKPEPIDGGNVFKQATRELLEEANIKIHESELTHCGTFHNDGSYKYKIEIFSGCLEHFGDVQSMTDETVKIFRYAEVFELGVDVLTDHAVMFLQAAYIAEQKKQQGKRSFLNMAQN